MYSETFGIFPSVCLIEVCKTCAMFVKIQRLLCTVIKFHVVKEASYPESREQVQLHYLSLQTVYRSNLQFIDS